MFETIFEKYQKSSKLLCYIRNLQEEMIHDTKNLSLEEPVRVAATKMVILDFHISPLKHFSPLKLKVLSGVLLKTKSVSSALKMSSGE